MNIWCAPIWNILHQYGIGILKSSIVVLRRRGFLWIYLLVKEEIPSYILSGDT